MKKTIRFGLWLSIPVCAAVLVPVSAPAAAGDLFEADGGTGIIYKFTPGETKAVFASGINDPAGLAFDASGNLFATEINTGTIYKFTRTGTKTVFASNLVGGLAFDAAGNLFDGDSTGGTITKITPNGTKTNFASGLNDFRFTAPQANRPRLRQRGQSL
jgi:outer membrane protein assembly factor BamB